jgi:hypothetical protein
MSRWRRSFIVEVHEKLSQLGLHACPACGSAELRIARDPVLALIGGFPRAMSSADDPQVSTDFLLRVECVACGHLLLFNAERFRTGDAPILVMGLSEQDEELPDSRPPCGGAEWCMPGDPAIMKAEMGRRSVQIGGRPC